MAKCKHTVHACANTEVKTTIKTPTAVFVNILEIYEIQMAASMYFLKTRHTQPLALPMNAVAMIEQSNWDRQCDRGCLPSNS